MKLKLFEFTVESSDPKPVKLSVKSLLFTLTHGDVRSLSPESTRGFTEDDYVDFDLLVSPLIGVSVNDLAHGMADTKVLEFTLEHGGTYLVAVEVSDKNTRKTRSYFMVFRIVDSQTSKIYSDDQYTKESSTKRLDKIAGILGLDGSKLLDALKKAGLNLD
ncbi:MAG: hypothetical protein ABWK01_03055 [Infirmifilum sp.]